MTHSYGVYIWHDSIIHKTPGKTRLRTESTHHLSTAAVVYMCDMTHSCVWHDSFIRVTWLIHVWHDSFICVTWLIHMCAMTHSYMSHNSFICVTWLIHMCDMTHSYVWHDSFICVPWLIHMCDMTHSYVWHDSFICETWLIHMCDGANSWVSAKLLSELLPTKFSQRKHQVKFRYWQSEHILKKTHFIQNMFNREHISSVRTYIIKSEHIWYLQSGHILYRTHFIQSIFNREHIASIKSEDT